MAYTKIPKPSMNSFLQTQEGGYLLLESGGRIILNRGFSKLPKLTAVYTKIAKPAIP